MKFNDSVLHNFTIKTQANAITDIEEIIETYYDFGKVVEIDKITVGDTNFNYAVTLEKDGAKNKYFAQLYNAGKSLLDLKHELTLREYFMKHTKTALKCAMPFFTKDGGYTVACDCPEIGRVRYFCLFEFMPGVSIDREVWAFGRMDGKLLKQIAAGIAYYHIGAEGFTTLPECEANLMDFPTELADYKKVLTEEFEKRKENVKTDPYYQHYAKYQARLLELLDRYTKRYLESKDQLTTCICHMDPSANNYLFDDDLEPITVCDLDWSQEHVRLFDICWILLEGFCDYDAEEETTYMDLDKCTAFVDAYDEAIQQAGNLAPGRLTKKEREMLPEIFQLVSIRFGYYNPWLLIMTDNPSSSPEYNLYWGNWGRTAIEYVEKHMDEFKEKLMK